MEIPVRTDWLDKQYSQHITYGEAINSIPHRQNSGYICISKQHDGVGQEYLEKIGGKLTDTLIHIHQIPRNQQESLHEKQVDKLLYMGIECAEIDDVNQYHKANQHKSCIVDTIVFLYTLKFPF